MEHWQAGGGKKSCKKEGCKKDECSCKDSCKKYEFNCGAKSKNCKERGCKADNCTCDDVCANNVFACGAKAIVCKKENEEFGAPHCVCGKYCALKQECDGADSCKEEGCGGDRCTCAISCNDPDVSKYEFECSDAYPVDCLEKGCELDECPCKPYCTKNKTPPCGKECVKEETRPRCNCKGKNCYCRRDTDCKGTSPCKCEKGKACGHRKCKPVCSSSATSPSTCGGSNTLCRCRISQGGSSACNICKGRKFRPCAGNATKCNCGCGGGGVFEFFCSNK